MRDDIAGCTEACTKTCLLDRGIGETVKTFVHLMKPVDHSKVIVSNESDVQESRKRALIAKDEADKRGLNVID